MGSLRYLFILLSFGAVSPLRAQLSPIPYNLAGSTYTQDFNGLPATGSFSLTGKGPFSLSAAPINAANLPGWQVWMPAGSNTNAAFVPGTGSSTGNGIYSLGASGNTDRALGSLSSSTGIYAFGLVLTNSTGMALNNCTISLTIEQWRRGGSGNRNIWAFRYKTGSFNSIDQTNCNNESALDLFSIITTGSGTSLNGNLPENRQQVSFTLQHINWKNGEQLLLRWDDADETGSDDVCAIDNLSFTAWQSTAPPTSLLSAVNSITSSSATLNGTVNEEFANTTVVLEYDTTNAFSQIQYARTNPDSILQGAGTTAVNADITGLLTGIRYYARIKATNSAGTGYSNTLQFTTAYSIPSVISTVAGNISPTSAIPGGTISHTGGLPISDQGVIWSLSNTGPGTQITMTLNGSVFSGTVSGLPAGTTIYTKAYATNNTGTGYGNLLSFTTPTTILSLTATDPLVSNSATIHFNLSTAQDISGLNATNFLLSGDGPVGAGISSISGSGRNYTITLSTGSGDGNISLQLTNDNNIFPSIYNRPFISAAAYRIDRSPPVITGVRISNAPMKLGDTVAVGILVIPDTAVYTLQSGKINNVSLIGFGKKNDSLYTAAFVINSMASAVPAEASIPVSIVLTDPVGNSNAVFQTPIVQSADVIDPVRPSISQTKVPEDGLYKTGDSLEFVLRFSEPVSITSTAPFFGFSSTIGSRTKLVTYVGGSGTDSLLFRYIIPAGELDNDGIRINSPLPLVNMEIRDLAGNSAILSYTFPSTKNVLVDAVAPVISSVTTPPAAAYRTGNLLDILVNFSEKVWIGIDTALLGVVIGNTTRYAAYTSGSGSTAMLFRYTVAADDMDKDGIKLVSPVSTIHPIQDAAGNSATLTLTNIGALSGVLINPPTISISKLIVPPDNIYRLGDTLEFEMHFNENAFVDTTNGIPALRLTIGSTSRQALYGDGSGSNILLFRYAIQKNETDTDGIRLGTTIALNNGTIKDEKGNPVPLTLNNIGSTLDVQVDAVDPFVKNVATPPAASYQTGNLLDILVNFSEKVWIGIDTPLLGVVIGNTTHYAAYTSGSGSTTMLFRYLIAADDMDKDGIKLVSPISTTDPIRDAAGNPATLALTNIGALSGVLINPPTISISKLIVPPDNIYRLGDTLEFEMHFNENAFVDTTNGIPALRLTIGSTSRQALYGDGSGSNILLFRYAIQKNETDTDGIRLGTTIALNNGTIKDEKGNPVPLTLNNIGSTMDVQVDAVDPFVKNVIVPPGASYRTGNLLDILVNFSEKVWVGIDTPFLGVVIGNITRYAAYTSGSGSTAMLFRYLIAADDMDKDGIKLVSPVSTTDPIRDAAGNPATLALTNIGALTAVLVNPPTISISKLIVPPDNTYRLGDTLGFEMYFNENAFVDTTNGIPALRLTIGNTSRQALYYDGSGSNILLFRYTIQKNDTDTDGIRLSTTIALNNGTIKDEKGNPAPLILNNIGNTIGVLVDAMDPFVKNTITPAKGLYSIGEALDFTVNFSENVFQKQKDSLYIAITIGNTHKKAWYVAGDSTSNWLFRYIVATGDLDKNGIRIDPVITINRGLLCDRWGNNLLPQLENIGALSGCRVDGLAPVFTEKNSELIICENAGDVSIGELLTVSDKEIGETLSWQLHDSVTRGILSGQTYSGTSSGNTINPQNIFYRPAPNDHGKDSIIIDISDGVYVSQKIIRIVIQAPIHHNEIGLSQQICTGNTAMMISGTIPGGGDGKYTYQWEFAVNNEAAGFSKAPGANSLSYYFPGKLSSTSWFRRKVYSGTCQDVSSATQIIVLKNGLWTGNYNSYWNNPNNWCTNTVPDQTTDVLIIPGTNYVPEISDSASVNQLQVASGATLNISGLLKLRTAIQNNGGAINASAGAVMFSGVTEQMLPGGSFKNNKLGNLYINNPSGIVLKGPLEISKRVTINSGSLITNNMLKLRAGAGIGACAIGTGIQGEISMEKHIHPKRPGFRLLGHPFSGSIPLSMIRDSIRITGEGDAANGFATGTGNEPSAYRFDHSAATDPLSFDTYWTPFTHTNGLGPNAWSEFSGIRLRAIDTTLLLLWGKPHTGNQEILLPQTNHRSYFVVANPYPSPVNLSKLNRSRGIGNHFWIWDPDQGLQGGYTSIPFNFPFTLDPFDAYIIRSDGSAGSILFTENCKTNAYAKDSFPPAYTDAANFIELRIESDSIFWDRLLLIHSDSASSYFDQADAEKLGNRDLNFYSLSRDSIELSIDTRPISNNSIIALGIRSRVQQTFSIRVSAINPLPGNTLQLHDKWLDKWTQLEKDSSYTFKITADSLSSGNQRFEIARFRPGIDTGSLPKLITRLAPVPAREKVKLAFQAPEKAHTVIRLLSLNGIPLKQVDLGIQQNGNYELRLDALAPGIYFVELRCGDQISLQKLIKQ